MKFMLAHEVLEVGGKVSLGQGWAETKRFRMGPNKCGQSESSDDDGATSPLLVTLVISSGDSGGSGVATPDETWTHFVLKRGKMTI